MTPSRLRLVAGSCLCLAGLAGGALGIAEAGTTADNCSSYATYSALASADGVLADDAPADLLPVRDADAGLPDAQAHIGSLTGSEAWAGAPYTEALAGNLGLTPVSANQVPVFVRSQYPTDTKETKDTPTASLSATTDAESANASVVGGAPTNGAATTGRVTTSAATTCAAGGLLDAIAHNEADVFGVAGVLRIGSVTSIAEARIGPTGKAQLTSSMTVEGATVLGQPVEITDKGIVAGSSTVPLPDNSSLMHALGSAGIAVDYIAGIRDEQQGYAFAPGLQITVTRPLTGVAAGNNIATFWLGGAFAQVSRSGESTTQPSAAAPPPSPVSSAATGQHVSPPQPASAPRQPSLVHEPAAAPTLASAPQPRDAAAASLFGQWSIERAYAAMAICALLLIASSIGVKKLAGRLQ